MITKLGRNDLCWCGSNKKYKKCHAEFDEKLETYRLQGHIVPPRKIIKNPVQIAGIRASGKINTAILDSITNQIKVGISTEEIDQLVHAKTLELGGIPAPLNYQGYPKSVCTSVNEQICHGIPAKDVILRDGDIVNIDVSTIYQGYFSDSSRMFCLGEVDPATAKLVQVVREAVDLGLAQVKPWHFLGDVAHAIYQHAKKHGYSVVREFGGHGIGLEFHEEPWVSFVAHAGTEMLMVPGMIFTVEPMINLGSHELLFHPNGWTSYTADGKPSAQWEVMVLVTEDGYEVLAH
ncbi:MAG TPA: methionyl aminopeptidase [Oscillospiraceae bacterium]|nr:methionyl aminopeptidase [Oscillospiraceae bacterium]